MVGDEIPGVLGTVCTGSSQFGSVQKLDNSGWSGCVLFIPGV